MDNYNGYLVSGFCRSGAALQVDVVWARYQRMSLNHDVRFVHSGARELQRFIRWRDVVRQAFSVLGGEGTFAEVVETIERLVPPFWLHRHWTVRIHRMLRKDPDIEKAGRDRWRLRASRSRP